MEVSRGRGFEAGIGRGRGFEAGISKGRGYEAGIGKGRGQSVVARVGRSQGGEQDGGRGVVAGAGRSRGRGVDPNSGLGNRPCGEKGRGRGGDQGSVLGSSDTIGLQSDARHDTLTSSHIEGSDGDDVSSSHVTSKKRGTASQIQVPEPSNCEWIYIKDGEFSNQIACTRRIGVNLQSMWSGPWESWKDVSNEDKKRLFERIQCYYQWEDKWNAKNIYDLGEVHCWKNS